MPLKIKEARYTLGAGANVPIRAPEAEALIQGRILKEEPSETIASLSPKCP